MAEADNEPEAAALVGYLESCGIEATYDVGGVIGMPLAVLSADEALSRQEILVRAEDVERAREALTAMESR